MTGKKLLIVSGGSVDDAFVRFLLAKNQYAYRIACDRGMEFFWRQGLCPDEILGDFDSADVQIVSYFQKQEQVKLEQFPAEKDWTDTELAVRRALELAPTEIHLVGATGSRLDHVLGNLQLLQLGLEQGVPIFLLDTHNRIRLINRSLVLEKKEQYGTYVSLIPYNGTVRGLTLRGMKYPLENAELHLGSTLAVSNEIAAEQAEIRFADGMLLVVEARD